MTLTADTAAARYGDYLAWVREQIASDGVQRELARLLSSEEREPDARPLYAELGRLGLLGVDWPLEHGGQGRSIFEAALAYEELVRAGVPDTLHVNTIQIVGLFVLLEGTPEQKARYLPAFARAKRFASVLYTEPGSGSDLASLRATARRDGEGFRLRGTKVFSLKSDVTDVGLAAVRTSDEGNKYAGISLFLVDLHAEGVRVTPIPSLADEQFHRVELHDVHLPASALIGEEGQGWPLLAKALAIERTGLDYVAKAERWLEAATDGLRTTEWDDAFAADVGRFEGAIESSRALSWTVLAQIAAGEIDEARAAAAKYYSSELAQALAIWAPQVHGGAYSLRRLSRSARRALEAAFREAPGLTLSAGTSEMMLQIVVGGLAAGDERTQADDDDVGRELREAVRTALASVSVPLDPHVPAVSHGADSPAWPSLRRLGIPGLEVPVERGGVGLGLQSATIVLEELGRAGLGSPYAGNALALHALGARDSAAEMRLASGLVEGGVAAAPAGFEARPPRAVFNRGCYVLPAAVVAAADAPVFLLPIQTRDALALAFLRRDLLPSEPERLADGSVVIRIDGVAVSEADVVAPLSDDDVVFAAARIRHAAYLAGIAAGAVAEAVSYANARQQFGEPLRSFQSVAFRLADAYVRVEAARSLVAAAAGLVDAGDDAARRARQAVALVSEVALDVARAGVQISGARGMTGERSLHRFYRMARSESTRFGTPRALWTATQRPRPVEPPRHGDSTRRSRADGQLVGVGGSL